MFSSSFFMLGYNNDLTWRQFLCVPVYNPSCSTNRLKALCNHNILEIALSDLHISCNKLSKIKLDKERGAQTGRSGKINALRKSLP